MRMILCAAAVTVLATAGSYGRDGLLDVPLMLGGNTKYDACGSEGQIVGLDPRGDGFLSVRSGPGGKPYREIDRLYNGNPVRICTYQGPWYGVVYGGDGRSCGVSSPWPERVPYTGPCKAGWIHSRYVTVTAG